MIHRYLHTDGDRDGLRTDGGDDVCPECGDPVSGLVVAGPGDVTAQPCGHAARPLLQESMDTVRPDGGEHVG